MIELTALHRFTITGHGRAAIIDAAQLGDLAINVGDHVLLDGAQCVILHIDAAPRMTDIGPGVIPVGLVIGKPDEALTPE